MRKFLLSAMLVSAAAIAAPASAQYADYNRYDRGGRGIDRTLNQLEDRIAWAAQNRRISRQEAYRLDRNLDGIERLFERYRRDGLSQWEHRDLRNRIQGLRAQFRWERQDGNWRDDRWRDNDRWDRDDDRWDDRRDRDDDRWDRDDDD